MALRLTTMAITVHNENESPVFGERATHVQVDDEAGGCFVVITQNEPHESGGIALDIDELEAVFRAAKTLIACQPKEDSGTGAG